MKKWLLAPFCFLFLLSDLYAQIGWGVSNVVNLTSIGYTSVEGGVEPVSFKLYPAYPNPFNPETVLRYNLPFSGQTRLEIFNISGQVVRLLVSGSLPSGSYSVIWNGQNESAMPVSSGLYLARLVVQTPVRQVVQNQKLILIR